MIIDVDPIRGRYEIAFDPEHKEHEPGRLLHCWDIDEMWKTEYGYDVKFGAGEYYGSIEIDDEMQQITLRHCDMCYEEQMPELLYIDAIIKLKKIYGYVNIDKPEGIQIDYSCSTKGFEIGFKNCFCKKHLPDGRKYVIGTRNLHFSNIRSFNHICTILYVLEAGNGDRVSVTLRYKRQEIRIRVMRSKHNIVVTYCPSKRQFDALVDRLNEAYRAFKEHVKGPNGGDEDKRKTTQIKQRASRQEESPKAPVSKDVLVDMIRNAARDEGDTGKKYDSDKRRYDLVDLDVIGAIADVLGFGAQKYAENSWQNLPNGEKRYFAALMRHLEAHQRGETVDPESGFPHIYHALTNVYFLTYFYNHREDRR